MGDYLASQRMQFCAVFAGGLQRQQQTAKTALGAMANTPELSIAPGWNEFDLDAVYAGIGPQLAADDGRFRAHWESVQAEIAATGHDADSAVNRRWTPADEHVVRAWVEGRYKCDAESWVEFRERIRRTLAQLVANPIEGNVAVFTSATPTAICTAEALGVADPVMFQLAGAKLNTAITELRVRSGRVRLFAFNATPHLTEPSLRTHR